MLRQANTGVVVDDGPAGDVPASPAVLRVENLRKAFLSGSQEIVPLDGINFAIERGEMVSIVGASGAGKSTFLHLLAALDTPTSGEVYFAGNSLSTFREAELAKYRNGKVGFVWQRHHLLPDFTAAENVAMPLLVRGQSLSRALQLSREWLGEVGLSDRADQPAGRLSGGEQQRVAIARALVNDPALLLADEPTGDLDERNAEAVFELIERLHGAHHLSSILATHNLSLARRADRVYTLEHGKIAPGAEMLAATASPAAGVGARTPGGRA
ncbi:MAG TPA: ABC transporter ATP-binding protein [Candidatus Sulfotelmatobacter sp.]|nr:ABC transporter ATP-binding protein [Candidatus Sulfotelmatobacter sp.]